MLWTRCFCAFTLDIVGLCCLQPQGSQRLLLVKEGQYEGDLGRFGLGWVDPRADPGQGLRCGWFIRVVITGTQSVLASTCPFAPSPHFYTLVLGLELLPRPSFASIFLVRKKGQAGRGSQALLLVCLHRPEGQFHPSSGSSFLEQLLNPVLSFPNILRTSLTPQGHLHQLVEAPPQRSGSSGACHSQSRWYPSLGSLHGPMSHLHFMARLPTRIGIRLPGPHATLVFAFAFLIKRAMLFLLSTFLLLCSFLLYSLKP